MSHFITNNFNHNDVVHGLLKNTAGYVILKRKNYQADAVKHFWKIDDAFTY